MEEGRTMILDLMPNKDAWRRRAIIPLRIVILVVVISSLLVFASILAGRRSGGIVQIGNLAVNDRNFTLFVEDIASGLRVDLAGTRCFEPVPDWLYPESEVFPIYDPPYSRPFLEKVTVVGVLAQCP
jgi:hypothetical protein